jgi:hypothetical protein
LLFGNSPRSSCTRARRPSASATATPLWVHRPRVQARRAAAQPARAQPCGETNRVYKRGGREALCLSHVAIKSPPTVAPRDAWRRPPRAARRIRRRAGALDAPAAAPRRRRTARRAPRCAHRTGGVRSAGDARHHTSDGTLLGRRSGSGRRRRNSIQAWPVPHVQQRGAPPPLPAPAARCDWTKSPPRITPSL